MICISASHYAKVLPSQFISHLSNYSKPSSPNLPLSLSSNVKLPQELNILISKKKTKITQPANTIQNKSTSIFICIQIKDEIETKINIKDLDNIALQILTKHINLNSFASKRLNRASSQMFRRMS